MPNYNFYNKNTKKKWTEFMSMAGLDEYLKANPHIEQLPPTSAPHIGDPWYHGSNKKPTDGFRDILREVKKKHKSAIVPTKVNTF